MWQVYVPSTDVSDVIASSLVSRCIMTCHVLLTVTSVSTTTTCRCRPETPTTTGNVQIASWLWL